MAEQEGKSILWVVIMLMLVVAWLGWTSLAASYARSQETWVVEEPEDPDEIPRLNRRRAFNRGVASVAKSFAQWLSNGFTQLPNLVPAVRFGFTERLWLIGMFTGFEVAILVLGLKMKQLESSFADSPDLDSPPRRRRKKRRRK